jgi:hypothetical protein
MNQVALYIVAWTVGVLVTTLLATIVGHQARTKGYSFSAGFLLSLIATPVVAWIVFWLLPQRRPTSQPPRVPLELQLAIELERQRLKASGALGSEGTASASRIE